MEYEITPQRQQYLDARGYIILTACPGSGKTTSIVKKLYSISQYCSEKYGKYAGYACLSFTNKACDELKDRYYDMHKENLLSPNIVSTIDSFVMQYIVLPFWYLCKECGARPIVINDGESLNNIYYNRSTNKNGEEEVYLTRVLSKHAKLFHTFEPAKIERRQHFYTWNNNAIQDENMKQYCEDSFLYRLKKGFITSSDAMWIACEILRKHNDIACALVYKFPYLIVDEAQDSSEMQFYFFSLLMNSGLENLEYVGDVCQAIYSYRNAHPEYLQELMTNEQWNHLVFTECRRSNQRIINLYSKLKPSSIPSIIAHNVEDKNIPILVYLYDEHNKRDIIRHFHKICNEHNLTERKILARGRTLCKTLSGIKDTKFKYWMSPFPYLIIDAKFAFENDDMNDAFRKIRVVYGELKYPIDINARKEFLQSIEHDADFNARIYSLLQTIPSFSLTFREWTSQMSTLLKDFCELQDIPDLHPRKKGIDGININDLKELTVEQFYLSNDEKSEYFDNINTIHSVKGATLDGVLLFLSENSQAQNISLNDFPNNPIDIMTEKQCMIYVACSRATQFLALAVPSTICEDKIAAALSGVAYKLKKINLQTELAFNEEV